MHPEASPQWQQVLFIAAYLLLLWELWRGWRLGAVRGLLRLTALFCAWIAGSAAAGASGTALAFFTKAPPLLVPAVFGLIVGLVVYLAISFLAGLLFKRTEDHVGVIRFGFGVGGAVFGLLYGLLLLWGGITLIRGLGALGEMRLVQAGLEGRPAASEAAAAFLLKLKNSLELGATGERLKGADPLPARFYDNMVKVSMVTGNSKAMERFFSYPATLEVLKNPKIQALFQDPVFLQAAEKGNPLVILRQTRLLSTFEDPQLQAQIKAFDLTAALDYALEPDPSQIQMQHGKYRRPVAPPSPPATNQVTTAPFPQASTPAPPKAAKSPKSSKATTNPTKTHE